LVIIIKKKKTWKGQNLLEGTKKMVVITIPYLECSAVYRQLHYMTATMPLKKHKYLCWALYFVGFLKGFWFVFNTQVGETKPTLQEDENY
jgi:hypothetical protein